MKKRYIRIALIIGAFITAGLCIYTSLVHEPGEETLEFTSEPGEITSDSLSYYMTFTGDYADHVYWDFGDGTSTEAAQVFKTYSKPGDYNVICKAVNDNGERYSGYSIHIIDMDHGLFDGYDLQIELLVISVILMIASVLFRGE